MEGSVPVTILDVQVHPITDESLHDSGMTLVYGKVEGRLAHVRSGVQITLVLRCECVCTRVCGGG